jgi:hypothetical protein
MIYKRVPDEATEFLKGNMLILHQKVPSGCILVYLSVNRAEDGEVLGVKSVSTQYFHLRPSILTRIKEFFFGQKYQTESLSSHFDRINKNELLG